MHNLVMILTDEDGVKQENKWHYPIVSGGSNTVLCSGQVFGEGEGLATFKVKTVQRGGVTCEHCLNLIKSFKKIKL